MTSPLFYDLSGGNSPEIHAQTLIAYTTRDIQSIHPEGVYSSVLDELASSIKDSSTGGVKLDFLKENNKVETRVIADKPPMVSLDPRKVADQLWFFCSRVAHGSLATAGVDNVPNSFLNPNDLTREPFMLETVTEDTGAAKMDTDRKKYDPEQELSRDVIRSAYCPQWTTPTDRPTLLRQIKELIVEMDFHSDEETDHLPVWAKNTENLRKDYQSFMQSTNHLSHDDHPVLTNAYTKLMDMGEDNAIQFAMAKVGRLTTFQIMTHFTESALDETYVAPSHTQPRQWSSNTTHGLADLRSKQHILIDGIITFVPNTGCYANTPVKLALIRNTFVDMGKNAMWSLGIVFDSYEEFVKHQDACNASGNTLDGAMYGTCADGTQIIFAHLKLVWTWTLNNFIQPLKQQEKQLWKTMWPYISVLCTNNANITGECKMTVYLDENRFIQVLCNANGKFIASVPTSLTPPKLNGKILPALLKIGHASPEEVYANLHTITNGAIDYRKEAWLNRLNQMDRHINSKSTATSPHSNLNAYFYGSLVFGIVITILSVNYV
mgnify:CR=1 FL=1